LIAVKLYFLSKHVVHFIVFSSFTKVAILLSQSDTLDKIVVPHQSSTSEVEYAVSTKTASMSSLNESPLSYATVDKKWVSLHSTL